MGDFTQINDDDSELLAGGSFVKPAICNGSKIEYIKNKVETKLALIKARLQQKYGG
jgi:hypothetical protein